MPARQVERAIRFAMLAAMIVAAGPIPVAPGASAHGAEPRLGREAAREILFDEAKATAYSQQAVGRKVGDYSFLTARGGPFQLATTRGKPVVVNLIYTSCRDACPLTVQTLAHAVDVAASAVGLERFTVLTIGFDTRADTPARMRDFAREQGIDHGNWAFLSADAATIERLSAELGFLYVPIAGGFDHLSQTTVVDPEGRIYRQIYGTAFSPQLLVEPLKELIFSGEANSTGFSGLLKRVKLLCTVYDPNSGRYRFSYAIFMEIMVGGLSLVAVGAFIVRAWLQFRRATLARRGP
jgi:protein SCO1/2